MVTEALAGRSEVLIIAAVCWGNHDTRSTNSPAHTAVCRPTLGAEARLFFLRIVASTCLHYLC